MQIKNDHRFNLIKKAWVYRPQFFVLYCIRVIASAICPFLSIFAVKLIVDELTNEKDLKKLLIYASAYCLLAVVINYLVSGIKLYCDRYGDDFDRYFNRLLCEKALRLEYYEIEDAKVLDSIEKARFGISGVSGGVQGMFESLFDFITNIITVLGVIVIIANNAPLIILLVAIPAVLHSFETKRINKLDFESKTKVAELRRIYDYMFISLTKPKYAKDIRLYSAGNLIAGRIDNYIDECVNGVMYSTEKKRIIPVVKSSLYKTLSLIFSYIYLGILLVLKMLSLGNFSMLASSAVTLNTGITGAIFNINQFIIQKKYINEYIDFMERPDVYNSGTVVPDKNGKHTIELKNVSFMYPGTNKNILDKVSFKIENGERVAIVGQNGAGKSTLIKLICGLYKPDVGEIMIDGINVKKYNKEYYNQLFSVVFQDFSLLAYSLAENIAIKKNPDEEERKRILTIFQTINFNRRIRKMPKGIDTTIYKLFDDEGINPSGGELQKIAIARALYKDAPIIILDEPTAALDPIAENEIYSNFDSLIGDKTAIYISHRMSSTKFCDRIIVLDNGRISEMGTHDELIAREGIYAMLYNSQAQFYNCEDKLPK